MRESDRHGEKFVIYVPSAVVVEMKAEAKRLERPLSWVVRAAWMLAKDRLKNTRTDMDLLGRERDRALFR